jgi:ankyrin repeat protein
VLDLAPQQLAFYEASLLIGELPASLGPEPALREALEHQVLAVQAAHRAGRPCVAGLLRSYGARGSDAEILGAELTLDAARALIAGEHRFRDWAEVSERGDARVDRRFEAAVDAIVSGDVVALEALLEATPGLARARSCYPHRTTLLHHVAANGIEHTRQWQSPPNAPEVARALLRRGADPNATCGDWAGGCNGSGATTLELLVSSCHPANAGVQADLVEVLCDAGAKADGIDDDGAPLWTAITFGYTGAVERLVRCGARVDNLVFAAVAGDLALVKSLLAAAARPLPASARRVGVRGPALDPRYMLEYALIYAAGHGRREVVELLLAHAPDLGVKDPVHRSSARGMAAYPHPSAGRPNGNPEIVELLDRAGRLAAAATRA